ncbi:MAG: hypothetical protein HC834_05800 [Rhodospirillales bacterium]|nr:hypothetical protein [Rhodospirillales bacterium]
MQPTSTLTPGANSCSPLKECCDDRQARITFTLLIGLALLVTLAGGAGPPLSEGLQRLNTRSCDVFMSLIPITPELSLQSAMTAPVRQVPVGTIDVDAILVASEAGAAWSLLHPSFSLVTPTPILLFPFGYVVARGDTELLLYLDT